MEREDSTWLRDIHELATPGPGELSAVGEDDPTETTLIVQLANDRREQRPGAVGAWECVLEWARPDGWYIAEHCFLRDRDGIHHVYYAKGFPDTDGGRQSASESLIGHAASTDLREWYVDNEHPLSASADEIPIGGPCIVDAGAFYMLFYHAGNPETIRVAISNDLWTWQKSPQNPVWEPPSAAEGGWSDRGATCPFILTHRKGYLLYYAARCRERGKSYPAVGLARSSDLMHWEDRGLVLLVADGASPVASITSPFVMEHGGLWHLFFTDPSEGMLYGATSDAPYYFDEKSCTPVSRCSGSRIVQADDGFYLSHCGRPLTPEGGQGLYLSKFDWRRS